MAATFNCDGCGDVIESHSVGNVWQVTIANNVTSKLDAKFDLCRGCAGYLAKHCDPRRWPKADRKSANAAQGT